MKPVLEWMDLPCGCSESSTGSVIVSMACIVHSALLSAERRDGMAGASALGPIPEPAGWL